MPVQILMPALSPTMTEGNLIKWHKKEGDTVKSGDILAEIETDKATMEVEAVDEGTIGRILVAEGTESVKVNSLIAVLLEEGENASDLDSFMSKSSAAAPAASVAPVETISSTPAPLTSPTSLEISPNESRVSHERLFATPLAKRLAQQNNLSLATIQGSGPRGRIIKADIETHLKQGQGKSTSLPPRQGFDAPYDIISPTPMRKAIAKRLIESKVTIPHFYLSVDCNIDSLLEARAYLNAQNKEGPKLSVNDFVIKACGLALKKVPDANTSWQDDKILQYHTADVSVAVAIEGGLITPIIRDADLKGLNEISQEMKSLASRAREGKLKPHEYQGGTFSLSNLGMFGIQSFQAIINPPQSCILAVGVAEERPIVKKGTMQIANMMTCTLSADHRTVDGAVGAQFLQAFREYLTNPISMLL